MNARPHQIGHMVVRHLAGVMLAVTVALSACADEHGSAPAGPTVVEIRYDSLLAFAEGGGYNYAAASAALGLLDDANESRRIEIDWGIDSVPADPDAARAFWIDAYNAGAVAGVLNNYPTKSVMDIKDYFKAPVHNILGEKLSLDQIEKEKLLADPPDGRIHFAIVCASRGCPPLLGVPYRSVSNLDSVLDAQTARAVNDPYYVALQPNGNLQLSKLFDWYAGDFAATAGSMPAFVRQYYSSSPALPDGDWEISYRDYDWTLNQVP